MNIFGNSFNSKLSNIKSSFQVAHDKASKLIEEMNTEISEKKEEISKIQNDITSIETLKEQASKFLSNLKGILA